jgi:transposase
VHESWWWREEGNRGYSLRALPTLLRDIGSCCALSSAGGQRVRVVLEATGLYALDLALLLSAHPQVQLMVANPRAVRHFAQAMMQRSKNDQLDAVVLLEFRERIYGFCHVAGVY